MQGHMELGSPGVWPVCGEKSLQMVRDRGLQSFWGKILTSLMGLQAVQNGSQSQKAFAGLSKILRHILSKIRQQIHPDDKCDVQSLTGAALQRVTTSSFGQRIFGRGRPAELGRPNKLVDEGSYPGTRVTRQSQATQQQTYLKVDNTVNEVDVKPIKHHLRAKRNSPPRPSTSHKNSLHQTKQRYGQSVSKQQSLILILARRRFEHPMS